MSEVGLFPQTNPATRMWVQAVCLVATPADRRKVGIEAGQGKTMRMLLVTTMSTWSFYALRHTELAPQTDPIWRLKEPWNLYTNSCQSLDEGYWEGRVLCCHNHPATHGAPAAEGRLQAEMQMGGVLSWAGMHWSTLKACGSYGRYPDGWLHHGHRPFPSTYQEDHPLD